MTNIRSLSGVGDYQNQDTGEWEHFKVDACSTITDKDNTHSGSYLSLSLHNQTVFYSAPITTLFATVDDKGAYSGTAEGLGLDGSTATAHHISLKVDAQLTKVVKTGKWVWDKAAPSHVTIIIKDEAGNIEQYVSRGSMLPNNGTLNLVGVPIIISTPHAV